MQRYESYKPSNATWLGHIPAHWDVQPLRAVTTLKSDKNQPDLPVLSVYREYGVILKDSRDDNHNATSLDTSTYKVVKPGDLVVNKMKAWQGSMGVSAHTGIVSPAYITCGTRADRVRPTYLHYLLRSTSLIGVYNSLSYGVRVGQWDMHYEDFKQIPIPLPPLDEQDRIVVFLDQKIAEIDAAITKKERLIELLEESLSIHISRAVTQGLSRNAPLRNSGYQWLGSIPFHWRPMKLAWLCSSIRDGTHNPPPEAESEYRLLSVRNIVAGRFIIRDDDRTMSLPAFKALTRSYTVQKGDVVLALVGGTTGKSAVVDINCENISVQRSLGILRPMRSKVLPEFLNFSLKAKGLQHRIWDIATKYAAQPGIYLEDVGNLKIAVPQISEQELIVQYCTDVQEKTFATIKSVTREIQSLRELKQLLVCDGISGKIKT